MNKLRIGILGLGRGITHLRNFLALDNADVIGACDRLPGRRALAQQRVDEAGAATRVVPEFTDLLDMRPDTDPPASPYRPARCLTTATDLATTANRGAGRGARW